MTLQLSRTLVDQTASAERLAFRLKLLPLLESEATGVAVNVLRFRRNQLPRSNNVMFAGRTVDSKFGLENSYVSDILYGNKFFVILKG